MPNITTASAQMVIAGSLLILVFYLYWLIFEKKVFDKKPKSRSAR